MTDPGYWCFTRAQLDALLMGLDPDFAVRVVQLLDSSDARRLGLHVLPRPRREEEPAAGETAPAAGDHNQPMEG